jgi:hypothetical protein
METKTLKLLDLGAKASSKHEVYRLLSTEGQVFLPPEKESPHRFLSDIFKGKKKVG